MLKRNWGTVAMSLAERDLRKFCVIDENRQYER